MLAGESLKIGDAGGGIQGLELAQNVLLKLQRDALDRFAFEDGLRVFVREVSDHGKENTQKRNERKCEILFLRIFFPGKMSGIFWFEGD